MIKHFDAMQKKHMQLMEHMDYNLNIEYIFSHSPYLSSFSPKTKNRGD
jgi:hypothetical protein